MPSTPLLPDASPSLDRTPAWPRAAGRAGTLAAFAVALLLAAPRVAEAGEGDDPRWCRVCHTRDVFTADAIARTAHPDLVCRDCHEGYHFDPHEPVDLPSERGNPALARLGVRDPAALEACTYCHETPGPNPPLLAHGTQGGDAGAELQCLQCHGDPHTITVFSDLPAGERRLLWSGRCLTCHSGGTGATEGPNILDSYEHSVHARKLALGSTEAPACIDCHGGHQPTDLATQGAAVCGACHTGATQAFAALASHEPLTPERRPVGYYTQQFFAWLTFITILLLALHVLFDLLAWMRKQVRKGAGTTRAGESAAAVAPVAEPAGNHPALPASILRFDIHQRLQHALMAASFSLLVLTGWPLSAHGIGASRALVVFFGGLDRCALVHRIAAVVLIACGVYHLAYLAALWARGKFAFSMLPRWKDVQDVTANLLYFFGLRKERPRFPRYAYFEKFDYWAVFWGMVIMVGSGLVRWFPDEVLRYAPVWVYEVAFHAHTDEAVLAGLAIFVWHFYNVHLRPPVFPMSWVYLTGRLTLDEMKEEHGAEYDALVAAAKAGAGVPAGEEVAR